MDAKMIVDKETKKIDSRKSDTDQWIVISIFGTLLTSLIYGIVIRIGYNYQKNRKAEVNNPGSENSELQDISLKSTQVTKKSLIQAIYSNYM